MMFLMVLQSYYSDVHAEDSTLSSGARGQ